MKETTLLSKKGAALFCTVCALSSGILGFGGGWISSSLSSDSGSANQSLQVTSNASAQTMSANNTDTLSLSQISEAVADSVVEISTESQSLGWGRQSITVEGAGSGVIISEDGSIVTNNHVVEGADSITIRLTNGETYEAQLIGTDSKTDLAVLKIDADGLKAAKIGSSSKLQVGDTVIAVGNPLGQLGGTVTSGIISALDREITIDGETMNLLQTDAAINPGNSGGALFNTQGELVGIVVAKSSGTNIEGLGFVIPIDDALSSISDLADYGYVRGRVYLGVTLVDIDSPQSAAKYRVSSTGLYVLSVENGSSAQQSGLMAGDRIDALNGKEVASSSEFRQALDDYNVGDLVQVTVTRDGETISLSLTLGEQVPESI